MELKPGYKQTEVGVIPEDWEIDKLEGGISLISGHHVLARYCNINGDGFPYITGPADLSNGIIQHSKFTIKPTTICQANDILITVKGSGAGSLVLSNTQYCISRQLMAIRTSKWNTRFIYYFLKQDESFFGAAATGLIPGLSRGDILNKVIVTPSFGEQTAIANALSDADALIQSLTRLIAKKRQIKQGAMQTLLNPYENGQLKAGWVVKKLGDIGVFTKGSGVRKDEAQSGSLPCIRYGEIYTRHNDYIKKFHSFISNDIAKTAKQLKKGDLLFAGSGETKEEIGKCVAFLNESVAFAGGDIVILSPISIDSLFFGYYLNTNTINKQKASMGQGDAVVHISATALANIDIAVPEKSKEQTRIATLLSDMDAEIAALEAKLAKYQQIKQGMMQNLLTGRIRLVKPENKTGAVA